MIQQNEDSTYLKGDVIWLKEDASINLGKNVQDINRPFVIVSNNTNNRFAPTVNIACLTKQVDKCKYPMHVLLNGKDYNFDYNFIICTEQIITVNKDFISNKKFSLKKDDLTKLNKALSIQLINEFV